MTVMFGSADTSALEEMRRNVTANSKIVAMLETPEESNSMLKT